MAAPLQLQFRIALQPEEWPVRVKSTVAVRSSVIFSGSPIGAIINVWARRRLPEHGNPAFCGFDRSQGCIRRVDKPLRDFGWERHTGFRRLRREPQRSNHSTSERSINVANHNWSSSSWRVRRSSRSSSARARVPLSRATMGSSLAATTERRSRRSISPASFCCLGAVIPLGDTKLGEELFRKLQDRGFGMLLPSLVAFSLSAFRRVRTAAIP